MSQIGVELIYPLIEIKYCDNSAQNPVYFRGEEFYTLTRNTINEILDEQECFSIKDLAINGNDLIKMGYTGKKIGIILNNVLEMVINEKIENSSEAIFSYIRGLF